MKNLKKTSYLLVMFVLIAAMALSLAGCGKSKAPAEEPAAAETVSFTLEVTGADGETKSFDITTDAKTVGDALLEQGLIEGEQGEFGLYIKTVDGETADYNVDGHYWAFYVNGDYAMSGVDTTEIEPDAVYALKVE